MAGQTNAALSAMLTSSAAASPAKTSQWRASAPDWPANAVDCSGTHSLLQRTSKPLGSSWKTCPAYSRQMKDAISQSLSLHWPTQGLITSSGKCLIRNSSESPSDAVESSLSPLLQTQVDDRYSLSSNAAAGILERSERKGLRLAEPFRAALLRAVGK